MIILNVCTNGVLYCTVVLQIEPKCQLVRMDNSYIETYMGIYTYKQFCIMNRIK